MKNEKKKPVSYKAQQKCKTLDCFIVKKKKKKSK